MVAIKRKSCLLPLKAGLHFLLCSSLEYVSTSGRRSVTELRFRLFCRHLDVVVIDPAISQFLETLVHLYPCGYKVQEVILGFVPRCDQGDMS